MQGDGGGGTGGKVAEPLLMTRSIKVLLTCFHLRPSLEISAANVSLHSCKYTRAGSESDRGEPVGGAAET